MPRKVNKIQIGNKIVSKDNFEKHQKYNPATGCTEWTGVKSNIGYGFIGYQDATSASPRYRMMTVHRLTLMIKLGRDIAPGMNANHSCHNKLCVTPEHLSEGTQKQKRADMVRDGISGIHGPRNVQMLRQNKRKYRYSEAEITWARDAEIADIAEKYNISRTRAASMRLGFRTGYRWLPWTPK